MDSGRPSSVPAPRTAKPVVPCSALADQVGEGAAVRQQQRRAARDVERAERGDEGRDVEPGDQQAVDRADQRPRARA